MLSEKQKKVVDIVRDEKPKILVCYGAKRAGKTYILIYAFLAHIARFKNEHLNFIIGGADQGTIRRNVLTPMEEILHRAIKLSEHNSFEVFGNVITCFGGKNADAWKAARGFTAAGALINEGTALNEVFVREVQSRCSYPGSRIYIDTNPENPSHFIKKDYIDNDGQTLSNGATNIRAVHFTLYDNDSLDPEYVESIVKSTPSGMFTERDIWGRWVSGEGVVYPDFAESQYVTPEEIKQMRFIQYFAGVDWGYEHFGAIALCGVRDNGDIVVIKIYAEQHKEVDHWIRVAHDIIDEYGMVPFYCDSEDPEKINKFRRAGINAFKAKKAVISGIEQVARGWKLKRLFVVNDCDRFKDEIYQYVWNDKTGDPIRLNDDVLSAIRYAVYSYFIIEDMNWDKLSRLWAA